MKRKRVFAVGALLVAMTAVIAFANVAGARLWRTHDGRTSSVDNAYKNGMLVGYTGVAVEDMDQVVFTREQSDLYLALPFEVSKGPSIDDQPAGMPRENYEVPFWIIRWGEPLAPAPPITPGLDKIAYVDWGERLEFKQLGSAEEVEDCRDESGASEDHGPSWLVSDCLISERAPAPADYVFCSETFTKVSESRIESTIVFPSDMHLFDVDALVSLENTTNPASTSASISSKDGTSVTLFSQLPGDVGNSIFRYYDDEAFNPQSTGTYKPEEPLSKFTGQPAEGTWKLTVDFPVGSNTTLYKWCLDALAYRTVGFTKREYQAQENMGTLPLTVELSEESTQDIEVTVSTVPAAGSDQPAQSVTKTIPGSTDRQKNLTANLNIPIKDNAYADGDELIALKISVKDNLYGLSEAAFASLRIMDDDRGGPAPPATSLGAYLPVVSGGQFILNTAQATEVGGDAASAAWREFAASAQSSGLSPLTSDAQYPSVASNVYGQPFVAWTGLSAKTGEYEVFVKYWDHQAGQWRGLGGSEKGEGISDDIDISGDARRTAITLNNRGKPLVAWEQKVNGTWQVYVKRWNYDDRLENGSWDEINGSATGGGVSRVSAGENALQPSITVSDELFRLKDGSSEYRRFGVPIVAYQHQTSSSQSEIIVRYNSTSRKKWVGIDGSDNGFNASNTSGRSVNPSIDEGHGYHGNPLTIALTWKDQGNGSGDSAIYLGQAEVDIDYFSNIEDIDYESRVISRTANDAGHSKVVMDNVQATHVVFRETVNGKGEIYYQKYDSFGNRVENIYISDTTNSAARDSRRPKIDLSERRYPTIVWEEEIGSAYEVYAAQWNGSNFESIGSESMSGGGISNNAGSSEHPAVSLGANGVPYVVWQQGAEGSRDIYFKWYQWWE